ncbi:MAG: response regulator transcription factor [Bacteroidia bacterium]|nr:response regulator transcription factor [Bacteroidia bacterium]
MYRAIIIDDEQMGINALKTLIERHTNGLKIVACATDPDKGIELIEDYKPEVVFLDISMPKMNAFELLEKLTYTNFKIVFTTAHETYAIKAIKKQAYDYLLKPIDIDELRDCVDKLLIDKLQPIAPAMQKQLMELPVKDGIIFIKLHEIIRLEASGSYTFIYLENNIKHLASKNMKECEALLIGDYFYRCHASHIVNLQKVERLVSTDGLFAKMSDGSMPEIARKNKEQFLERLKNI